MNSLKVLMNKHAMKRITFDSFKSHLYYLRPNLMWDVFIDTFERKNPCLVSYLDSVCAFWIACVIFEKNINYILAVKPVFHSGTLYL